MHTPVPLPGDLVWIRQRRWRVERARIDGRIVRLDVQNREGRLTFLVPFDRTAVTRRPSRPKHVRPQQALARLAALIGRTSPYTAPAAAVSARLDILPHQLEPVLAVLSGARRLLIADEVGLGKTIQAGLILAELRRRMPTFRALVITPAGLREQWAGELRVRFDLSCEMADRSGMEEAGRLSMFGESAWQRAGIWIASADYLKQPHVQDGLPLEAWDAVVVDEAHDASGPSERHVACHAISQCARHVILLSATPHCGDQSRFSRLLELGRLPALDRDALLVFRRTRADISLPVQRRVCWRTVRLPPAERRLLDALIGYEQAVVTSQATSPLTRRLLLLSVFRKRALSTVHALTLSLNRRLEWLSGRDQFYTTDWMQPRLLFEDGDEMTNEECLALAADSGLPESEERTWLRRLRTLAADAIRGERKIAVVANAVARTTEAVVVFTEFRESLDALSARLASIRPIATLHGSQTASERRRELQRFLSGEATVLVATDVAGQGLNLQSRARWVISLELPWNPARLEQRVGRVDRIGQRRPVHATVLVARHDAEDKLLASLARRALTAQKSLGSSVLRDVAPPGSMAVAAASIMGSKTPGVELQHPVSSESNHPPPLCTSFRIKAAALTRLLLHRRRLLTHWRTECADQSIWTSTRTLGRWRRDLGPGPIAIFSVPLVDGTAAVIERQLIAIRLTSTIDPSDHSHLASLVLQVAARPLEARRRRLAACASRASSSATLVQTALAIHLHALRCPEDPQPGLFHGRARPIFESVTGAPSSTPPKGLRAREFEKTRLVQVGRPALEVLFIA